MKKLNSKGFTLIELLAVIVVLAIVMVIAVTSVLNSTSNAAVNSFNSSALTVADFAKQQEALAQMGTGNAETCYETWRGNTSPTTAKAIGSKANGNCFGLNDTDYDLASSTIQISGNNATVILCAKDGGKFDAIATHENITVDSNKCITVTR